MIKEAVRPRVENRICSSTKQVDGTWLDKYGDIQINAAICIRSRNYGSSLAYILSLVEEAKKDFPFITDQDIKVICFGGNSFKGTYGIEFNIPNETIIPPEYADISYLHPTN